MKCPKCGGVGHNQAAPGEFWGMCFDCSGTGRSLTNERLRRMGNRAIGEAIWAAYEEGVREGVALHIAEGLDPEACVQRLAGDGDGAEREAGL